MNKSLIAGFLLLVTIDTASQVCIKIAGNRISAFDLRAAWFQRAIHEPLLYLVLVFFAAAFMLYINLLKHVSVGPVYAAAHAHIVTVLTVSVMYFGEKLGAIQVLGAFLILVGVAVLGATEKSEAAST